MNIAPITDTIKEENHVTDEFEISTDGITEGVVYKDATDLEV